MITLQIRHTVILTTLFIFSVALPASAQFPVNVNNNAANLGFQNAATPLIQTIENVVNVLLGIVGFIALLMVVWGGIRYIISRGNDDEVEKAKYTIFYALVGLLVIGISAALVNFVLEALQ